MKKATEQSKKEKEKRIADKAEWDAVKRVGAGMYCGVCVGCECMFTCVCVGVSVSE